MGRCALSGRVRDFYGGCASYAPRNPAKTVSRGASERMKTEVPEHVRNPYHKRDYVEFKKRAKPGRAGDKPRIHIYDPR